MTKRNAIHVNEPFGNNKIGVYERVPLVAMWHNDKQKAKCEGETQNRLSFSWNEVTTSYFKDANLVNLSKGRSAERSADRILALTVRSRL